MSESLREIEKLREAQGNFTLKKKNSNDVERLYGVFSKYAKPELLDLENGVWERTVLERQMQNAFAGH